MTITKFLDPKNDFCFKQVFGTEKNKDILIHFLNDILKFTGVYQIIDVTFLKTVQDAAIGAYRQSIVDVLCKDQNGDQIIVEMQISKHKGFEKRAQFYAAKAYSQQVLKEDENHKKLAVYAKLKAVIFLAIANFTMFPEKKAVKSEHRLLDTKTHEHDLKDFYFVFLELEKFKKTIDQLENIEDKWLYFLKHAESSTFKEIEHLIGSDGIIRRAFEAIDQAAWTEEELNTYEQMIKTRLDNLAVEQQKIEDAEIRGEARGEIRGEARGEARGEIRGKAERDIEIARKMLSKNHTISDISDLTGLPLEEISKL